MLFGLQRKCLRRNKTKACRWVAELVTQTHITHKNVIKLLLYKQELQQRYIHYFRLSPKYSKDFKLDEHKDKNLQLIEDETTEYIRAHMDTFHSLVNVANPGTKCMYRKF